MKSSSFVEPVILDPPFNRPPTPLATQAHDAVVRAFKDFKDTPMKSSTFIQPDTLFAFWRYDTFPYALGGTVTEIRDDGMVETREFGKSQFFRPFIILPHAAGLEIKRRLKVLEDEKRKAQTTFDAQWNNRLFKEIPEVTEKK